MNGKGVTGVVNINNQDNNNGTRSNENNHNNNNENNYENENNDTIMDGSHLDNNLNDETGDIDETISKLTKEKQNALPVPNAATKERSAQHDQTVRNKPGWTSANDLATNQQLDHASQVFENNDKNENIGS